MWPHLGAFLKTPAKQVAGDFEVSLEVSPVPHDYRRLLAASHLLTRLRASSKIRS